MTESSVSPPTTVITPQEHERLLDAAREALALLDRIDRHAPEGLAFGGEGRVRRILRDAIRQASFEVRDCPSCEGGTTLAPVRHPMERPRIVNCEECSGTGQTRVFAYPKPKARRER